MEEYCSPLQCSMLGTGGTCDALKQWVKKTLPFVVGGTQKEVQNGPGAEGRCTEKVGQNGQGIDSKELKKGVKTVLRLTRV